MSNYKCIRVNNDIFTRLNLFRCCDYDNAENSG